MTTTTFFERLAKRIDRIDRKDLENYVFDLIREKKFLTSLLNQLATGIIVSNPNSEVIFLNRRTAQLFNLPEQTKTALAVSDVLRDPVLAQVVSNSLKERNEIFQQEIEVLLPRPMILQISVLFSDSDGSENLTMILINNLSHAELKAREQFKSEHIETLIGLAAGIAHEIGNPINALTIHLKLLSKTIQALPRTEQKKLDPTVRILEEETRRLDQIVRNFLRNVRRKPIRYEPAEINVLLSKTITFFKPELKQAKIRVVEHLDQTIQSFLADEERLRQVFVNIIKNALHAMPNGGTLYIKTELKGKLCFIHFRDTGAGISEEKLPKIFDSYYTTKEEGSGLGLVLVHQIIREHGGRIEVVSKPQAGTTFTLILPIRKEKLGLPGPARTDRHYR